MIRKLLTITVAVFLFFQFFAFSHYAHANPPNRFITIVNPVRASNFWQSEVAVQKQIDVIKKYNLSATWLIQYSLLTDEKNLKTFKDLPKNHEIGVFLEVDEKLATDSYVAYIFGEGGWSRADKVLLSGYEPGERKLMIDQVFDAYKRVFGVYPQSVGAWYIDTVSLDYLADKYKVKAVLDVADQYDTDSYGLWGKPWGTAYYPSKLNSLMPAKNNAEKLDVVKIQWAQRDPYRGYGLTPLDSTFSVQANDYLGHKLGLNYFHKLSQIYLSSENKIGQLTVGLEAGQEGAVYLDEFEGQIKTLIEIGKKSPLNFVTMASFSAEFKRVFPKSPPSFFITAGDYEDNTIKAYWYSSASFRIGLMKKDNNLVIRDLVIYKYPYLFADIYKKDTKTTLKRIIPHVIDELLNNNQKILLTDIKEVHLQRLGEDITFTILDKSSNKHEILLQPDKVTLDGQVLFRLPDTSGIDENISHLLVNYWKDKSYPWTGSWRYSFVDNKYYFGLLISPSRLIGFKSEFPFLGIYDFPFQVLTRFKTLPEINLVKIISANFVNRINNSTIRILKSIKI